MNSKGSRLVEHQRVVRHEERISCRVLRFRANACEPTAFDPSDTFSHLAERNPLVGVHWHTQLREIDHDRINRQIARDLISA
jgi:hypothetical protein